MEILVLNGSSRGMHGKTLAMSRAFVLGLCNKEDRVHYIALAQEHVHAGLPDYSSWEYQAGGYVFKPEVIPHLAPHYAAADIIIWNFPLVLRDLPVQLRASMQVHCASNNASCKHIVIASGDFRTTGVDVSPNMDALFRAQGFAEAIICSQGGLLGVNAAHELTQGYLEKMRLAGREFAQNQRLCLGTRASLGKNIIPQELYIQLAHKNFVSERHVSPQGCEDYPCSMHTTVLPEVPRHQ